MTDVELKYLDLYI